MVGDVGTGGGGRTWVYDIARANLGYNLQRVSFDYVWMGVIMPLSARNECANTLMTKH